MTVSATIGSSLFEAEALRPGEGERLIALNLFTVAFYCLLAGFTWTRAWKASLIAWMIYLTLAIAASAGLARTNPIVVVISFVYVASLLGMLALLVTRPVVGVVGVLAIVSEFLVMTRVGIPVPTAIGVVAYVISAVGLLFGVASVARQAERDRLDAVALSDRFREVIQRVDASLLVLNEKLAVLELNPSAEKMLKGRAPAEVFLPEHLALAATRARETGSWVGDLVDQARRGATFSATMLFHPGRERGSFFSLILRDQTLERQVRRMERMDTVGQLAGGIAHDFNNALAAIISAASLLETEVQGEAREDVEIILSTSRNAVGLTRRLLAFSRRAEPVRNRVDVVELVRESAKLIKRTVGSIDVKVETPASRRWVMGDSGELEHTLLNLAINARDAMPSGGTITIGVTDFDADGHFARVNPPLEAGPCLCISVEDRGTGIPADVLEHIFEPFFTTKEVGKGTGLGLASVFTTVRQHGGAITVYSEVGHGTTFRIYLRALDGAVRTVTPEEALHPRPLGQVLIVDDDPQVREAHRRLLGRYAADVHAAHSVDAALEASERIEFDLVVLDVVMPGPGVEAIVERLRTTRPQLPVLLVSGFVADARVRTLAQQVGIAFLAKPVEPSELERVLPVLASAPSRPG